jgi:hypothetical protein
MADNCGAKFGQLAFLQPLDPRTFSSSPVVHACACAVVCVRVCVCVCE